MTTKRRDAKQMESAAYEIGKEMGAVIVELGQRSGVGRPDLHLKETGIPNGRIFRAARRGFKEVYESK